MKYEIKQLEENEYFVDFFPEDIKEKDKLQTLMNSRYRDEDYLIFHLNIAIEEEFQNKFVLDNIMGEDLDAQYLGVIVTLKTFPSKAS